MWDDLSNFFQGYPGRLVACAIVIVAAPLVAWGLRIVIRHTVRRIVTSVKRTQQVDDTALLQVTPVANVRIVQRTRTLGSVLINISNVLITVIAVLLCVNTLAPNILGSFALLTAAVGAGLGFGAQNIVKDILNGLFLVLEDQLGVGDIVDTGFATGVVESVGIRVTQVRDVNGTLWYVRNGEMIRIGNMSQGWARAIVDVSVPYEADIDAVQAGLLDVASKLADEAKWRNKFLDKPEAWGIQSISGDAIVFRIVAKTRSNTKDEVARELRRRLRPALEALDVRMPTTPGWKADPGTDGAATGAGGKKA